MENSSQTSASSSSSAIDQVGPHGALFLVLGYLRLPDLLSFQRVCRSFRDAVNGDSLLWRRIAVETPLNAGLTDEALLRITSKAEGKVASLSLFDCPRITDRGLLGVVSRNPGIKKLYVPGCTSLTADGVVKAAKRLTEREGSLQRLRIYGIRNIRREHLDILKSVCKINPEEVRQQSFYGSWHSLPPNSDDGNPIDVDICPKCTNIRMVFDCTRENCRAMRERWSECRGCFFCIARCEDCGGCIDPENLGEETACSHLLCLECWLRLPKCNLCNRPYCYGHEREPFVSTSSSGFVCEICNDEMEISNHFD